MSPVQWPPADMDSRGHLPGRHCLRCNKPLQGADSGYPAESYAGTYTGYCYPCNDRPAEIIGDFENGAVRWSYPPHCPSWRRDREHYIAFSDCTTCKGKGCVMVSRSLSLGGSYGKNCDSCFKRFFTNQAKNHYDRVRARLVELTDKYSGRKWKNVDASEYVNHPDAIEYRELLREFWALPTPKGFGVAYRDRATGKITERVVY